MTITKIGIISLGCPRNLVDSQNLLGTLHAKGYEIVDIQKADIGLVNTCAFIEAAKKESIDAILDLISLKQEGRLKKIIVAGCLPERYKEALLPHLKEVDAFMGKLGLSADKGKSYALIPHHFAYLKISEGCNHPCSFCSIPKIKGKLQSRAIGAIVKEAKCLDEEGKAEINIIGQDISQYGLDIYKKPQLALLLAKISAALKKARWIRLLYLHPNHLTPDLVKVIARDQKICKYVDVPFQHINNRILKAMRRKTDKKKIVALLSHIRKEIPGLAIRTSLIVGFPGETEKEFKELLCFEKEQKFDRLGVFIYTR
jgi:ribosomal protein S12 methylthiotransferase